jgi:non-heme chloroperoxidase
MERPGLAGHTARIIVEEQDQSSEESSAVAEQAQTRKSKTITVDGTKLHYIERGQEHDQALILVHGGLGDLRTWSSQMGPFSERYHVVSYSRRGHYPNEWDESYTVCSMAQHADDLGALIDRLGLGSAHIVANSYGGYVALYAVLRHPQRIRSLALAEPPVHPILRRLPGGEEMFQQFIESAWRPAGHAFAAGDMEGGVRFFLEGAVGKGAFDELPPRARDGMMKNAPELAVSTHTPFEVQMPDLTCEDLSKIEAPALLMRGENSPGMYHLINDELARCLPHAEQAVIPAASHVLHSHNPQVHNETVLRFLDKRRPTTDDRRPAGG